MLVHVRGSQKRSHFPGNLQLREFHCSVRNLTLPVPCQLTDTAAHHVVRTRRIRRPVSADSAPRERLKSSPGRTQTERLVFAESRNRRSTLSPRRVAACLRITPLGSHRAVRKLPDESIASGGFPRMSADRKLLFVPFHGRLEAIGEQNFGLPGQQCLSLCDIRTAFFGIILGQRMMHDL